MGTVADSIRKQIRVSKVVVSSSKVHPNKASDFVSFTSMDLTPDKDDGWTLNEAKLAHAILSRECEAARMRDSLARQHISRQQFEQSKVLRDYDALIAGYEKKVEEERSATAGKPVGKVTAV